MAKPDHTELVNKILTGARWATALRLGAQAFSWISTIIVVRFISPEDYGLNSMLESPLILMMLISTLGLDAALVQAKHIKSEELQSIFGWLLIVNGLLFLSYFFGGTLLAAYFNEPRLDTLAKALAFIFLFVPFRVIPNALLDRELNFKSVAQIEITATVIAAALTLTLAYLGAGVWALVMGILVNKLLLAILLMIFKPWFIVPRFNFSVTFRLMSVGGILTLASTFTLLSGMLATLIAGPKLGSALLGLYSVASQFALLPLTKGMPIINKTMLPAFSKFQSDRNSATYYLERLLGVISLVFVPMMVGLACVSDTFVITLFGAKWAPSTLPLTIMSLGVVLRMNTILLRSAMIGMGRSDLILKSSALQLGLLLLLTIYAVEYGIIGLATAWVLTEILITFATARWSKMAFDTTFISLLKCYRPALVSSAIMAICVLGSKYLLRNQHNMVVLIVPIAIGLLSYYLATRFLFLTELQTALKTVFGNRFLFLAPRIKEM